MLLEVVLPWKGLSNKKQSWEAMQDPAELDRLLARGAEQARAVATPKLHQMMHRMGMVVLGS